MKKLKYFLNKLNITTCAFSNKWIQICLLSIYWHIGCAYSIFGCAIHSHVLDIFPCGHFPSCFQQHPRLCIFGGEGWPILFYRTTLNIQQPFFKFNKKLKLPKRSFSKLELAYILICLPPYNLHHYENIKVHY